MKKKGRKAEESKAAKGKKKREIKKKAPVKGSSRPVIDPSKIPEGRRKVLEAFPVRNPSKDLKWSKKDGLVIIKIKKRFSKLEKKLHKVVGGPEWLRIPLDGPGSLIWELCDGDHTVLDISFEVHSEFKEEVEPVIKRIIQFLEMLLKRNLILLKPEGEKVEVKPEIRTKKKKGLKKRKKRKKE